MTEITNSLEILVLSPIPSLDFASSLGLFIPIIAVSLPAIIILIVFVFESRNKKMKYNTIIEVSKNISDPEEVRDLLESLQDKKKSPIDLRRSGVITIFVGAGLFMLGWIAIGGILEGVGALVGLIGVGQMVAGYIYPNQSEEINKAVEEYEKK
jgi:Na+-transporting NADH:ubiquinone oxidoreductase subunit NqrE